MRRVWIVIALFTTGIAFAQSSEEFGRSSGGQLDLTFKAPSRFSGSFGLTTARSTFGTFGGTLMKDRAWFFATGERTHMTQRFDGNAFAPPGDRNKARPFLSLRSPGWPRPAATNAASANGNAMSSATGPWKP